MRAKWATGIFVGLMAASVASTALAAPVKFDTPEMTFNAWKRLMQQHRGKTEFIKRCYSQSLRATIEERTKSPEGSRRIDQSHMYYDSEITKYRASEPEEISATEARIWLIPKDGSGDKVELKLVLEDQGWKIDEFPNIGTERDLGAWKLAGLAVILFVIIIVLAKKVLLT